MKPQGSSEASYATEEERQQPFLGNHLSEVVSVNQKKYNIQIYCFIKSILLNTFKQKKYTPFVKNISFQI